MKTTALFDGLSHRITQAQQDGDSAYFNALTLNLEYITKLVTSGVIACLADDGDRQRYSMEYELVRANSLGQWVECLNAALLGQSARLYHEGTQELTTELTQHAGPGDWRYDAVTSLNRASVAIGATAADIGRKTQLHQFFAIAVRLRNRSRGHGATTIEQCSAACPHLIAACDAVVQHLALFTIPWVYLRRNLSGKYRVSPLLNDPSPLHYLKQNTRIALPDGVYLYAGQPLPAPLVFTNADVSDISLANGAYQKRQFETLSYVTNDTVRRDGSSWSNPPGRLPPSETEGRGELDLVQNTFTNVPTNPKAHVRRKDLEDRVRGELLTVERHPIVSLTGPGGIGKTTTAIAAIEQIVNSPTSPYDVILWISARDVDLLDSGPKPVSANAVTQRDIARVAVTLLNPGRLDDRGFDSRAHFQECLSTGGAGPTLFVFDNFETMDEPDDVYKWLDTYIRLPNKVLITTRVRNFVGDFPIHIGGMTDSQALRLVDQHARHLGVSTLLTTEYRRELVHEASGHPYVLKILLGDVAHERRAVKPRRVVASNREMLRALFERTYNALSPAGQRVFLLLCSWRVSVPEVGVEAVLLRLDTTRFDVVSALEELDRYSLVERVFDDDGEGFVSVPLAAAEYGKRKLEVSQFKVAIEQDLKLLREFGVGRRGSHNDAKYGVFPRIENLVRAIAKRASENAEVLKKELPVLEFLASRVPKAYLRLAQLVAETDRTHNGREIGKAYVRRFLEEAHALDRKQAWLMLADLCEADSDVLGEIHALCESTLSVIRDEERLGGVVNRLNRRLRNLKEGNFDEARSAGVQELLERVCENMYGVRNGLTANNCSRLAWLCLNIGKPDRAREVVELGLVKEPRNEYCLNLVNKLYD